MKKSRAQIADEQQELVRTGVTVTITGPMASGKTTLRRLFERLLTKEGIEVAQFSEDRDLDVLHMKLSPDQMSSLRALS